MALEVASAEVTAAWIAAGAAIVAALASVIVTAWTERRRRQAESTLAAERLQAELTLAAQRLQAESTLAAERQKAESTLAAERQKAEATLAAERRDAELILAALGYFQGSQRRSVGIAALRVLNNRRGWNEYQVAVSQLFYRQLLYLFAHAGNRWQAHEISNIEGMTDWLLDGKMPVDQEMRDQLRAAMARYELTWEQGLSDKAGEEADDEAVDHLVKRIEEWRALLSE